MSLYTRGTNLRSIRDLFDPLGPTYERVGALLSFGQDPRWRRRLVDAVAPRDGERVVDVATGTGLVARALKERAGCVVVGVDISAGMIGGAPRDGVRYVLARAERLPFADASFDALTFTYLLRYVDDPAATLRELARVVRDGGRLASLEFHVPRPLPLRIGWWLYTRIGLRAVASVLGTGWRRVAAFLGGSISAFYARHPLAEVEAMWRAAGIADVRSETLTLGAAVVTWGTKSSHAAVEGTELRPAFYALAPGGWRDYLTLLHPPYTAWHLSYVVLGAALAPVFHLDRLFGTLLAFFLALGIGVHALDELNGRPLGTRIPRRMLVALAVGGVGAAVALGIAAAALYSMTILIFVAIGIALAAAYPLELAGGKLHGDLWFALGWGAFPVLTAYWASALELSWAALLATGYAIATSYAQRRLSTWVRLVRRRTIAASGELRLRSGERRLLDASDLIAAPESALRWLAAAVCALALAVLVWRLT